MNDRFYARFKASARRRKSTQKTDHLPWVGLSLMTVAVIGFYCVLFPSGMWGKPIKGALATAFGIGRFFIPLWVGYVGLRLSLSRPWPQALLRGTLSTGLQLFLLTFTTLFSQIAFQKNAGGLVGLSGAEFLTRLFGAPGAWLVSLTGIFVTLAGLSRVSPVALGEWIWDRLHKDIEEWRTAREQPMVPQAPVVTPRNFKTPVVAAAAVAPTTAPSMGSLPASTPVVRKPPEYTQKTLSFTTPPPPEKTSPASVPSTAPTVPYVLPALFLNS
jgi:hypothetical protein